jgi:hypothetical protein
MDANGTARRTEGRDHAAPREPRRSDLVELPIDLIWEQDSPRTPKSEFSVHHTQWQATHHFKVATLLGLKRSPVKSTKLAEG